MESFNSCTWHIVMRRTNDIFACRDMDEVWYLDFDRHRHLLYLLYTSQQVK